MPEVSVIIVTTKDKEDILCLPKFNEDNFNDYEIIIRDDKGIAKARNEGVKKANTDKIIFIDDDAEPKEGYLQAASDILEQKEVVVGKITHPGNGILSRMISHYPTYDEGQYVEHVVGCNMGYRREVFDTIGYFDENFSWGREEGEFIDRVKKEYPIYYEPDMEVIHSYADGAIDYWQKMYAFGPADVYYSKKRGKSNRDIIKQLINPFWYINGDPVTWPISIVGRLCRSVSQIKAIRKQNSTDISSNDYQ